MEKLVSLAYRSLATGGEVDEATLATILVVAQAHNVENQVTGALAYQDGQFVQVLEGPEASVASTMDRIRADTRHHSISVAEPIFTSSRDFPDWSMARISVEPLLKPALAPLFSEWELNGPQASQILARALD